jgi:predicted TIM-barrel fold metal-dependent hydrolase
MPEVDLDFKPTVPVFDANIALGRRHDRRVAVDTVEDTLAAMDRAGVERALAYSPHAANYDSREGNDLLMETIAGGPRIVPQMVGNPTWDELDEFADRVAGLGVRSIRLFPKLHNYPFADWVVEDWMAWLARERIPVWLPVSAEAPWLADDAIDPKEVHDTVAAFPDVTFVLSEVRYNDMPWALVLLRRLPNLHVEISRTVQTGGVTEIIDTIGAGRVLFGSRFPDSEIPLQLYSLHRSGLSDSDLRAICAGNLERLLGMT